MYAVFSLTNPYILFLITGTIHTGKYFSKTINNFKYKNCLKISHNDFETFRCYSTHVLTHTKYNQFYLLRHNLKH